MKRPRFPPWRARSSIPITDRPDLDRDIFALTFDDGPSEWTIPILNTLRSAGVHATFFVVGDAIHGREETLKQASADGHEIGNHGLGHRPLDLLDRHEVLSELTLTSQRIDEVIGVAPRVFRPPYFRYDQTVLEVAARCGFGWTVNASVYAEDWLSESSAEISAEILARTQRGSIIALHDGRPPHDPPHATGKSRDDRWPTVEAVKIVVPALAERGFEFVTVSELLAL